MKPIHIGIVLVIALIILYFCYQKRYEEHFQSSSLDVYYNNERKEGANISINQCGRMVEPGGLAVKEKTRIEVLDAKYYVDADYSGPNFCDTTTADYYPKMVKNEITDIRDPVDRTTQVSRAINYSLNNGGTLENIQCSSQFVNKCFPYDSQSNNRVSGSIDPQGSCYFWNDVVYGFGPQIAPAFFSKQTMEITYLMDGVMNKIKFRYGEAINLRLSNQNRLPVYKISGSNSDYSKMKINYPANLTFNFTSQLLNYSQGMSNLSALPTLTLNTTATPPVSTTDIYGVLNRELIDVNKRVGVAIIPFTPNTISNISTSPTNESYLKDIAFQSYFIPIFVANQSTKPLNIIPTGELESYLNNFPDKTYFMFFPVGLSWSSLKTGIVDQLGVNSPSGLNYKMIKDFMGLTDSDNGKNNFILVKRLDKASSGASTYTDVFKKLENGLRLVVNETNNVDNSSNNNELKNMYYSSNLESACMPYYPNSNSAYWGSDYSSNQYTNQCSQPQNSQFSLGFGQTCNPANNLNTLISGSTGGKREVFINCEELNHLVNFQRFGFKQSVITLTDKTTYDKKSVNNQKYTNSFKWVIEPIGNKNNNGVITNTDNRGFCYIYSLRVDAVGNEVRNYLTANSDNTVSVQIFDNGLATTGNSSLLSTRQQWLLCENNSRNDVDGDGNNDMKYYIRSRSNNAYLVYKLSGGYPTGPSVFLSDKPNTLWIFNLHQAGFIRESFEGSMNCSTGISPFKTLAKTDTPATETNDRSNWNSCFASYWNGDYIYQETDPNSASPDYCSIQLNQGSNSNEGLVIFPKLNGNFNIVIPVIASSAVDLISKSLEYPRVFLKMMPFADVQISSPLSPDNLVKVSGQVYFSSKPNDMVNIPGGSNPSMFMIKKTLNDKLVNQSYLAAKGLQTGFFPGKVNIAEGKYVIVENDDPTNCGCDKYCAFDINKKVSSSYKAKDWKGAKAVAQAYRGNDNILHIQDLGSSVPNGVKSLDCYCEENNEMPFLNDCKDCKDLKLMDGTSEMDAQNINAQNCLVYVSAITNLVKMVNGTGSIYSSFVLNPKWTGSEWADVDGGRSGNITLFSFNGYLSNIAAKPSDMTPVNIYSMPDGSMKTTTKNLLGGANLPAPSFALGRKIQNFPYYLTGSSGMNKRIFSVFFEFELTGNSGGQYGLFGKEGYQFGIQITEGRIFPYAAANPYQYPRLNGNPTAFVDFRRVIGDSCPEVKMNMKYKLVASWDFLEDNRCQMRITVSSQNGNSKCYTYTTANTPFYVSNYNYNLGIQAAGPVCNCNEFRGTIENIMIFGDKFFTCDEAKSIVESNQNLGVNLVKTIYLFNNTSEGSSLRPITIVNSKSKDGNSFIYPGTAQEFKLNFSCNPGSYPMITGQYGDIEKCCRGPYPFYGTNSGDINVSNQNYKKTEVVNSCESDISSILANQGAGIQEPLMYDYETYYVLPLPHSFPNMEKKNNLYVFKGPNGDNVISPAMSAKVAIALMGNMGTTNDLETIYKTYQVVNQQDAGWVLAGNLNGREMKYGYVKRQGLDKSGVFGSCPDGWTYNSRINGCYAGIWNRGICANPSYFSGYSDNDKVNWANSCKTSWTRKMPQVSLNPADNKYKGVNLSETTYDSGDTIMKSNLWVKGAMPIYFPPVMSQMVAYKIELNKLGVNPDKNNKYYWKDPTDNCFYSQYAIQRYDNVKNPQKIMDNRSMYFRQCL